MPQTDAAETAERGLTERDRAILDFEAEWSRHGGAKEEAIRAELERLAG